MSCKYLPSEKQLSPGDVPCIAFAAGAEYGASIMKRRSTDSRKFSVFGRLLFLSALLTASGPARAQPPAAAVSAFNSYVGTVECAWINSIGHKIGFIAPVASGRSDSEARLRKGELIIEQLTPSAGADLPGAMLHHWRGTGFVPGAAAADFERLMKDFNAYPQHFSPQVLQAKVLAQHGDLFHAAMRVRQKHVITVVMDTTYDITYGRLDARHGNSISRSTQIQEIGSPGTSSERALSAQRRARLPVALNTYWSYEERDGGLYMQIESVSLTRSIPNGLGWIDSAHLWRAFRANRWNSHCALLRNALRKKVLSGATE